MSFNGGLTNWTQQKIDKGWTLDMCKLVDEMNAPDAPKPKHKGMSLAQRQQMFAGGSIASYAADSGDTTDWSSSAAGSNAGPLVTNRPLVRLPGEARDSGQSDRRGNVVHSRAAQNLVALDCATRAAAATYRVPVPAAKSGPRAAGAYAAGSCWVT